MFWLKKKPKAPVFCSACEFRGLNKITDRGGSTRFFCKCEESKISLLDYVTGEDVSFAPRCSAHNFNGKCKQFNLKG